ncbi:MAG: GTPase Era [Anaerolineae bacterium]|nr:GTPase Era [Anaerolineae bacterium]MCA9908625.1 GTPase Era [Anaerolineae bacterium]
MSDIDPELDSVFENTPSDHRSGMVAVVGRPNVGKSTLINRILGQKVAAVSPKPQTTRKRQLGIYTGDHVQILFIDTPGLHLPRHKLGEYMVKHAESAFKDADVILLLHDISQPPDRGDQHIVETLTRLRGATPVLLALNKADVLDADKKDRYVAAHIETVKPEQAFLISALTGEGVDLLLQELIARLPFGPRYYPAEQVSEVNMRFIAAETIREKVMLHTEEEIPHATAVEIDSYRELPDQTIISGILYVERDSQKGILIGKGGSMIKRIGSEARQDLEAMTNTQVYLDLRVKVLQNWRKDARLMQRLGYNVAADEK